MPEGPEIRFMKDFINQESDGKVYRKIRKSTVSKVKTPIRDPFSLWSVSAESRGKELKLIFTDSSGNSESMIFSMGMSGNWGVCKTGNEPKHSHFMIDSLNGSTLYLNDVRRFAKWRWGSFNLDRSPCIMESFPEFKSNLINNLNHKDFDQSISEILMNQKWFNGMGNYLRSTVLFYSEDNPFMNSREFLRKHEDFADLCHHILWNSYILGGGQIKDWKNPLSIYESEDLLKLRWNEWVFYQKGLSCTDKSGRRFWFEEKWKEYCPYPLD